MWNYAKIELESKFVVLKGFRGRFDLFKVKTLKVWDRYPPSRTFITQSFCILSSRCNKTLSDKNLGDFLEYKTQQAKEKIEEEKNNNILYSRYREPLQLPHCEC